MKNCYVYIHINPIKNEIFYVGIGYTCYKNNPTKPYRPYDPNRSNHWKRIVNKYGLIVEIIHEKLTWEQACDNERYYIKMIGRYDLKEGTLINKTDGADGIHRYSPEMIEKIRNAQLGRRGYKHTPEACAKISKAHLGSKRTDQQKLNISNSLKGKIFSEERKKSMSLKWKRENPGFHGSHTDKTKETIRLTMSNITTEMKELIIEDIKLNLKVQEIADKYNVKYGQVSHIKHKYVLFDFKFK